VPHIIKYMGAKKSILDYVIETIGENYSSGRLCDLFGGTSVIAGALGKIIPLHSNDIQEYSSVLAKTYLSNYEWQIDSSNILDEIIQKSSLIVAEIENKDETSSSERVSAPEYVK